MKLSRIARRTTFYRAAGCGTGTRSQVAPVCRQATVPIFEPCTIFCYKRIRWMTVMRYMRPWGHFGLLFTWGLAVGAHCHRGPPDREN